MMNILLYFTNENAWLLISYWFIIVSGRIVDKKVPKSRNGKIHNTCCRSSEQISSMWLVSSPIVMMWMENQTDWFWKAVNQAQKVFWWITCSTSMITSTSISMWVDLWLDGVVKSSTTFKIWMSFRLFPHENPLIIIKNSYFRP